MLKTKLFSEHHTFSNKSQNFSKFQTSLLIKQSITPKTFFYFQKKEKLTHKTKQNKNRRNREH